MSTLRDQLDRLLERQLALRAIMRSGDPYACRCEKTGKKFATEYPDKKTAYDAAFTEYEANEPLIEELKRQIAEEEAEPIPPIEQE